MSLTSSIRQMCTQTAVYWAPGALDGMGGRTYEDPVEISCRWEDKSRMIQAKDGLVNVNEALVYSTTEMAEFGMLYLGSLIDLDSSMDPKETEAWSIKVISKFPSMRGTTDVFYKYFLSFVAYGNRS